MAFSMVWMSWRWMNGCIGLMRENWRLGWRHDSELSFFLSQLGLFFADVRSNVVGVFSDYFMDDFCLCLVGNIYKSRC